MRTNQRNKLTVWYALYAGTVEELDADGNYTGEYEVKYEAPVKTRMNVSGARGQADVEMFGIDNPYTRTLITDDLTTPFDTDTVFWVGINPEDGEYNYRCTGVATTINTRTIAIRQIDAEDAAAP